MIASTVVTASPRLGLGVSSGLATVAVTQVTPSAGAGTRFNLPLASSLATVAVTQVTQGLTGPSGATADRQISTDAYNRLRTGSDQKLFVPDTLNPDPLAYYILAKS